MGIDMNEKVEEQQRYIYALYEFNKLMGYRQVRPWYYINIIWKLTPSFRYQRKLIKIMHDFTSSIIRKRKQNDCSHKTNATNNDYGVFNKKMAMLDLLLSAKANGYPIDENDIREEVDTFSFEVCISF